MQEMTARAHLTGKRWSRALATAAVAGVLVSGCAVTDSLGIYLENERPHLPQLSADQLALQSVARHEQGLAQALAAFQHSAAASDCPACMITAKRFQTHASERITQVGGVWDPWPQGAPKDAPTLAPLPVPPAQIPAVVERALATAIVDLRLAAKAEPDTRRLVAAAAGGRIGDALGLAQTADIDDAQLENWIQTGAAAPLPADLTLPEQVDSSPASPSSPSATGNSGDSSSETGLDQANRVGETASPQSSWSATVSAPTATSNPTLTPASADELSTSARAALVQAQRGWDCVQDLLPRWVAQRKSASGPSDSKSAALTQVDELALVISTVRSHGITEERLGSCTSAFLNTLGEKSATESNQEVLANLENRLAATNVELFAAQPDLALDSDEAHEGLSLSVYQLVRGMQFWVEVAGADTTPALVGGAQASAADQ